MVYRMIEYTVSYVEADSEDDARRKLARKEVMGRYGGGFCCVVATPAEVEFMKKAEAILNGSQI